MATNWKSGVHGLVLASAAALLMAPALGQTVFPSGPIRMVAPFPAGGSVDTMARAVGDALANEVGQPVIIENRPGADGAIGTIAVINAPPDGQTLLFATTTPLLVPPTLRLKLPYDPTTALTPISFVGRGEFLLYVHSSVPATTVKELVEYARANPGKLSYAAPNSTSLLASAQLVKTAGVDMTRVPYRGEAPAIPDLITGRVHVMFAATATLLDQVKAGTVRILAVLGGKRSPLAPQAPTLAEAGFPEVSVLPWVGIFGPAKLPEPMVARLSNTLAAIILRPDVAAQIERQSVYPERMAPADLAAYLKSQLAVWHNMVKEAGLERN